MLLALLSVANAADVLIPEATPASLDDFSVAYMVYDLVVGQVGGSMYAVEDGDAIRKWADKDAEGCFDEPACPANLWGRTDARLAVVMGVGKADGGLAITARFYEPGRADPLREIQDVVPAGAELAFAKDLAMAVNETIVGIPKRKSVATVEAAEAAGGDPVAERAALAAEVRAEAEREARAKAKAAEEEAEAEEERAAAERRKIAEAERKAVALEEPPPTKEKRGSRGSGEEDAAIDAIEGEPGPPEPLRFDTSDDEEPADASEKDLDGSEVRGVSRGEGASERDEQERRRMRLPRGAYERYRASGKEAEDWLADARVRQHLVSIEAAGGWGFGSTDRAYGVWVSLGTTVTSGGAEEFEVLTASTWEGGGKGEGGGSGLAAGAAVGFQVAWFVQPGLSIGVQQGRKYLEAGWECEQCEEPVTELDYPPVVGTQGWIQPRVRFFLTPTGILKPYLLGSLDIGLYDGFVPYTDDFDFPVAKGGVRMGASGGVGLAVDAIERLSFFVELPYSFTFPPVWRSYDDFAVENQPAGLPDRPCLVGDDTESCLRWPEGVFRPVLGVAVHF